MKKRQDRSKEISNHNYVTGNKLLDAIKEEKKRMRTEVRYANYPIFNRVNYLYNNSGYIVNIFNTNLVILIGLETRKQV